MIASTLAEQHTLRCNNAPEDGVYIMSPSGAVRDAAALQRASHRLQELGFAVAIDPSALASYERFAGSDEERLRAIQRSLAHPYGIVMAARGGYGLSRLLSRIDWHSVARSGKRFVGHSDFTAFNLALLARTGAVSYSGVCAAYDFGRCQADDYTQSSLLQILRPAQDIVVDFSAPDSDPVCARGLLWGGNLAMVASLVGTPYLPQVDNGILFLEDVGEHPYRVERMLIQLWHAGVLQRQQALLLGHFTDYQTSEHDQGYGMASVVSWLRTTVRLPVISGLPYGHVARKAVLPIGRQVALRARQGKAQLCVPRHECV